MPLDPVTRPWGRYQTVALDEGYLVKVITVEPGSRTSLQYHLHRAETWTVVRGTLRLWRGADSSEDLGAGTIVRIGTAEHHRIDNPGPAPLVIVEVQLGDDLREDDIVRLEDDYGRG